MRRRVIRVILAVLLAYLLQSTVLPFFKIRGVILDLISITLYTVGYACGIYTGFTAGVFCAMIMESISGDLPGVVSAFCVLAGVFGGWSFRRLQKLSLVGNRQAERLVKRFAPMVLVGLFVIFKEFVYVVYFYLTGMDISFTHVYKILLAGIWAGVLSLVLIPVLYGFLLRRPEDTLYAKLRERRKARQKAKQSKKDRREKVRQERKKSDEEPEDFLDFPEDTLDIPLGDLLKPPTEGGTDE